MRKVIHNLRKQPEEVRRSVLHLLTLVCGVILAAAWVFSLGRHFGDEGTQAKMDNDLKPIGALKANLIGGYQSITEQSSDGSE